MPACNILLVRHPETEANITARMVGRGSSPFTATGEAQAERLPQVIADFCPDAVWTSPLHRAHVVAERAVAIAGVPLHVDERLLELDFGDAEGMTLDEIAAAGIEFNFKASNEPVAPGGESRDDIARRSAEVLDEIVAEGGRHAVVAHGGIVRSGLVHLLGLPEDAIWKFHIRNAIVIEVSVTDGFGMLERLVSG